MKGALIITGEDLTLDALVEGARSRRPVALAPQAKRRIEACRKRVERLLSRGDAVYGVTTGFGSLAGVAIKEEQHAALQLNLLRSHAAGTGAPLPEDVVRAMMLLRVNTFARGLSGVRLSTAEALVGMLNAGVYPVVPEKGSVGASGDLAPLAHLMLVLVGRGEAFVADTAGTGTLTRVPGAEALKLAGLAPIPLAAKEGLSLVNGTAGMTALLGLACHDALRLLKDAHVAAAASCEALRATPAAFDARIHEVRPHPGQLVSAAWMSQLLRGSALVGSSGRVQDCYSLRCVPQVMGASLEAAVRTCEVVECELNSVTDNPLVFEDGEALSGGNFHGQPLAIAADLLGICLAELGALSERRIARLVDSSLSDGLPPFLIKESGLNSGFMLVQVTAAALASENKVLAHPASVDSIPTSAGQEDHVSMGMFACRKAAEILANTEHIIATELFSALQALEFRTEKPGKAISAVRAFVRQQVPAVEADRELAPDIEAVKGLMRSGAALAAAEKQSGKLRLD